jgi:hypothetical protein
MKKQKPDTEKKTIAKANGNENISTRKPSIQSKGVYDAAMQEIDLLMKKGENNLSSKELNRLRSLAEAAELYEDSTLSLM